MSSRAIDKLTGQRHQPAPWYRQSNETEGDHDLFLTYRNMNPRSYGALAASNDLRPSAIEYIAEKNQWESRII